MPEDWRHGGFGLYLHWPFCQAKCPYCDFNSHVAARIDQSRWRDAYLREIDRLGAETDGRVLASVFFGGGTPSLMEAPVVEAIMDRIRATWPLANEFEVTLEANPTSVEAGRFAAYRDAGVNRVSLGVQALNDRDLKALGRLHSAKEALKAVDVARSVFGRISFDLIYARQGQGLSDWEEELSQALSFGMDHLSLYQLTIEPGTAFGDRYDAGKLRGLPDDDLASDLYFLTQELCASSGMPAYEVSNHARAGHEGQHNLIYWRSGDYIGIGPGAHGRLTLSGHRFATEAIRAPGQWLAAVENMGSGDTSRDKLSGDDRLHEFLLMGLRLRDGISLERLIGLGGDVYLNNINGLESSGWLETEADRCRVSAKGWPVLNGVLREILGR